MPYKVIYVKSTAVKSIPRSYTSFYHVEITFPTSEEALIFKGDPETKTRTMNVDYGPLNDPLVHEFNMLLIQHGYTPCDSTFRIWHFSEGTFVFRAEQNVKYLSVGAEIDYVTPERTMYKANFVFSSDEDAKTVTGKAEAVQVIEYPKPDRDMLILPDEIIQMKAGLLAHGYKGVGNPFPDLFDSLGLITDVYYLRAPAPEPKKRTSPQTLKGA